MGGGLWGQHVWSGSVLGQALAQKTHIKLLFAWDLLHSRMRANNMTYWCFTSLCFEHA